MMPKKKPAADAMHVLFVDDETNLQEIMRTELPRLGYRVTVCPDGETAVAALQNEAFDCLLVDLNMPGIGGIDVINHARELRPETDAIILTGNPSQDTAIDAIRTGMVFEYLTKPCRLAELSAILARVSERRSTRRKFAALMQRVKHAEGTTTMVSSDAAMQRVTKMIAKVSPSDSSVLIRGETGTGKELVARSIHEQSLRADGSLVPVNCGALPENLIESELFGHVKGAFTGADTPRTGLFEVASGGTLFLDEIGELPLAMQAKLLRVLETGEIRPLGETATRQVDVRIVAATHRDLEQMVQDGEFREDLMFRINTFEVVVPPLRDRLSDIGPLAVHLLRRHRVDGGDDNLFTESAMEQLAKHRWPGNVRELANVIEHAAILCDDLPIDVGDLPQHFARRKLRSGIAKRGPITLRDLEMLAIHDALERNQGNKPAAAEELGISLKTLYNKVNAAEVTSAAA